MDKKLIGDHINGVLKELEGIEKKDKFVEMIKKYEEIFYKEYESRVQNELLPELQKKDVKPESASEAYFLQANNVQDKEYLQGYYRFNKFNREPQDGDSVQYLQKRFQQGAEVQFSHFVQPSKNFVDVEANTKYYFPEKEAYIKDVNRPPQDFANTQTLFLNEMNLQNIQNPEVKNVYPRNLLHPIDNEIPRPEMLKQHQPDLQLKRNIEKLGGIEDTIATMEPSLREHEVNAFLNQQQKWEQLQFNYMLNTKNIDPLGKKPPSRQSSINNLLQQKPPSGQMQAPPPQQQQADNYDPFNKNPFQRLAYQEVQTKQGGGGGYEYMTMKQQQQIPQPQLQQTVSFQYQPPPTNNTYLQRTMTLQPNNQNTEYYYQQQQYAQQFENCKPPTPSQFDTSRGLRQQKTEFFNAGMMKKI